MAKELGNLGHDVQILAGISSRTPGVASQAEDQVIALRALDLPMLFRPSLMLAGIIWLIKNASRYDLVIINPESLWLSPLLRHVLRKHVHLDIRTLPVNVVTRKRRIDRFLFWKLPIRLFVRSADSYSFITERLREAVEKEFDLAFSEYAIWSSGVDTAHFSPRSVLKSDCSTFVVFYHGSISLKRGLGTLVEAMSFLKDRTDIKLVIVGDGPDLAHLSHLVSRYGIESQVELTGQVSYDRVPDMIRAASVCVCPLPDFIEWNVSSPLKVLEYMACAKPIIATPIAAHRDILARERFVIWTDGSSASDFAAAILESNTKRETIEQAAKEAPAVVKRSFQWKSQAQALSRYLTGGRSGNGSARLI